MTRTWNPTYDSAIFFSRNLNWLILWEWGTKCILNFEAAAAAAVAKMSPVFLWVSLAYSLSFQMFISSVASPNWSWNTAKQSGAKPCSIRSWFPTPNEPICGSSTSTLWLRLNKSTALGESLPLCSFCFYRHCRLFKQVKEFPDSGRNPQSASCVDFKIAN